MRSGLPLLVERRRRDSSSPSCRVLWEPSPAGGRKRQERRGRESNGGETLRLTKHSPGGRVPEGSRPARAGDRLGCQQRGTV